MLVKTALDLTKGIKDLKIEGKIVEGKELKDYSTLRIGGQAEVFVEPFSWKDIEKVTIFTQKNKIPLLILGGGSKVLFSDEMFKGVVLYLNNSFFKKIELGEDFVKVSCGVTINELLNWMVENSLGGWEFLAGIPGTLGGTLCLNSGVRDCLGGEGYIEIGDFVKEVTVLDKSGNILKLNRDNLIFEYRKSNLSDFIILEAKLIKKERKSRQQIRERISKFINYRRETQELRFPSAGCVFKNPFSNRSSGELIELSGLKGKCIGDIAISEKHANFFINLGKGTAGDFLSLMEYVQKKVKFDHGIWLEPEIKIIRNSLML
ncbi:MAG: UDP-N-acetylmuramate dehydrogenase [Candidatus Omnitrophica bacterium]|nr:UDP-N-acetylmuramate dehydrogenase [Candidatus Omnitrophota bacterium]MCM8793000.1 UDP-N-acetylmuramate dehydrogenase [Candidatus Omnitrophota bacterium]